MIERIQTLAPALLTGDGKLPALPVLLSPLVMPAPTLAPWNPLNTTLTVMRSPTRISAPKATVWNSPASAFPTVPLLAASAVLMAGCNSGNLSSPWLVALLSGVALVSAIPSLMASAHILTTQRGSSSVFGWLATAWLPVIGPLLWLGLGMAPHLPTTVDKSVTFWKDRYLAKLPEPKSADDIPDFVPDYFKPQLALSRAIARSPLTGGNLVEPLHHGEEAFPVMLKAIEEEPAGGFVYIGMFIYEHNDVGANFTAALRRAVARGVDVRVIVDRWGNLATFPTGIQLLHKNDVPYRKFAPSAGWRNGIPWNVVYHKKFMATSHGAFVGSINIGNTYELKREWRKHPHQDITFRVRGPALPYIANDFLTDWNYIDKVLQGLVPTADNLQGDAFVRVIRSGPDEWHETFKKVLMGALRHAGKKVRITTAYFAPDAELLTALKTAAESGIEVELMFSEDAHLPFIDYGARAVFAEMLHSGVRILYQPPPFDHSKFIVVDDFYCLFGSSNLGPRYLSGNLGVNLEVYDKALAAHLSELFDRKKSQSLIVDDEMIAGWTWFERLRNGAARMVSWLY